jgi:hypothetical protein
MSRSSIEKAKMQAGARAMQKGRDADRKSSQSESEIPVTPQVSEADQKWAERVLNNAAIDRNDERPNDSAHLRAEWEAAEAVEAEKDREVVLPEKTEDKKGNVEEQLAAIQKSLEELKKQNEQLRQENEQLRQMVGRAQEIVFMRSNIEISAFVSRWTEILISSDYYVSALMQPNFSLQTIDRTRVIWWLPDIITNRLRVVYGPQFGVQPTESLMIREIQNAIINRTQMVSSGFPMVGQMAGYPPVPSIGQVVAGGNVNINQVYGFGGMYPAPGMAAAPEVAAEDTGAGKQAPLPKEKPQAVKEQEPDLAAEVEKQESKPTILVEPVPEQGEPEKKEKEEPEPLLPKDDAVNKALQDLLGKYNLEGGYGKWRQGILPLVAGFGAAIETGKVFSDIIGGPIAGGLGGAAFSLAGSLVRRYVGKENTFSLFARYSHIEGGKGFKGFLKKVGQLFTRGMERVAIKEALMLDGSKEVKEMVSWSTWGKIPDATIINLQGSPDNLQKYVVQGLWYLAAHQAVIDSGAYLTEKEQKAWAENEPKITAILRDLLQKTGYDFSQESKKDATIALMEEAEEKIQGMERKKYNWSMFSMGGAAALKGLTIGSIGSIVRAIKNGFAQPPVEVPSGAPVPGPENIPGNIGETVHFDQTLGHTFDNNGIPANYLWEPGTGTVILNKFGELNAGNPDVWKQLWWVATESRLLSPESAAHLKNLLTQVGIDGNVGDFAASAEVFNSHQLSYTELMDLFRWGVGRLPYVEQNVLGHAGNAILPDRTWVGQIYADLHP